MVTAISFDDYYRPISEQKPDENGMLNFDLPDSVDHEKLLLDLHQLISGHPVVIQKYRFENFEAPQETEILAPAQIVVVEGLFTFEIEACNSLLNHRVFVESDAEIALERRLRRDTQERGIPADRSIYQWKYHVTSAWEKYILPHRDTCDLILENSTEGTGNSILLFEKIDSWLDSFLKNQL